jgi:hypothetical protein
LDRKITIENKISPIVLPVIGILICIRRDTSKAMEIEIESLGQVFFWQSFPSLKIILSWIQRGAMK